MATDPAVERREGALTANRIAELAENPIQGKFDVDHLKAVHAYIFQDLPHHCPGEMRSDTSGWSKFRALEGQVRVHEVHYAHDHIEQRAATILRDLGGPAAISGLPPDAFASRIARLYGDLDHVHSFHEGNSRTLRELTRSLVQAAGYDLNWTSSSVDAAERNRLYVARDIAVLERAFPGLTPQRGMETNDRAEFEASLALPALRRAAGASLETIIREGLTQTAPMLQESTQPAKRRLGIAEMALAALSRQQAVTDSPTAPAQHTPIAERMHLAPQTATPLPPAPDPKPGTEAAPGKGRRTIAPTKTQAPDPGGVGAMWCIARRRRFRRLEWCQQVGAVVANRVHGCADRPQLQHILVRRTQKRGRIVFGLSQPQRPVGWLQHRRHPIMHRLHEPAT